MREPNVLNASMTWIRINSKSTWSMSVPNFWYPALIRVLVVCNMSEMQMARWQMIWRTKIITVWPSFRAFSARLWDMWVKVEMVGCIIIKCIRWLSPWLSQNQQAFLFNPTKLTCFLMIFINKWHILYGERTCIWRFISILLFLVLVQ